jgi:hypothetical protein
MGRVGGSSSIVPGAPVPASTWPLPLEGETETSSGRPGATLNLLGLDAFFVLTFGIDDNAAFKLLFAAAGGKVFMRAYATVDWTAKNSLYLTIRTIYPIGTHGKHCPDPSVRQGISCSQYGARLPQFQGGVKRLLILLNRFSINVMLMRR